MKKFLPLLALIVTSCAIQTWQPYVGPQQAWPVSQGSFIEPNTAIPVFENYPPKPYIIIGQVRSSTQSQINLRVEAAHYAKARGADALIVNSGQSFQAGSVAISTATATRTGSVGTFFSAPIIQSELSTIAIKWQDPADAAEFRAFANPAPPARSLRNQ